MSESLHINVREWDLGGVGVGQWQWLFLASIDSNSHGSPMLGFSPLHGASVGHALPCRSQASEFGGPFHPLDKSAAF